jgi:hypothetical protein
MVEMRIEDVTSTKIKRWRVGQGKPSWIFVGRMVPLEVHQRRGFSDQNHFFQPSMTKFPGKTRTIDIETTRTNSQGAFQRLK